MFKHLQQLLSDSLAFSIATVGNKLFSLVIRVFFFYKYLPDPQQHGVLNATNSMTLLITYFCILGTDVALAYYYFHVDKEEERKSYLTTAVLFSTGVCFLFLIIFTVFSEPFSRYYLETEGMSWLIILALISTLEGVFIQQILAFARFSRKVVTFNVMSMFYWIGSSGLGVAFLSYGYGITGIFIGQVLAGGVAGLILLYIFRSHFTLKLRKAHLMELIRYGIPLVPSLISFWVMSSLSGPLLLQLKSKYAAGIYGTAINIASFIALVTSAFQLAWRPFSMSMKDRVDAPRIFSVICRLLLVIGTFAILFLTFFIKEIVLFITKKEAFLEAYPIIWMFSFGTLLNTLYVIMSTGLLIKKKTSYMSKPFFMATFIYLIGNLILIPYYSYWGTAIMTIITYIFVVCYVYKKAQYCFYIPYKMKSILIYISIYLVTMVGITYLQVNESEYLWLSYIGSIIILLATIFASNVFGVQSLILAIRKLRSTWLRKYQ